MASFETKVYRLEIEEHPNADRLELAKIGDYRSIVLKGQFKDGDLGVYIPEASMVPDWLIRKLGLEGKLAGKQHNRVKAVKLRGVLSQGLVLPVIWKNGLPKIDLDNEEEYFLYDFDGDIEAIKSRCIGIDVARVLGITKYEPPIPVHMSGEVRNTFGKTLKYDIENFKKYPDVLREGESVVFTEKVHGTWCCFGWHPELEDPIVTSKGLSERGLSFKLNERNKNNLYVQTLISTGDQDYANVVDRIRSLGIGDGQPVYLLGEIYGRGIQDLQYGATKPQFRVFDIYLGEPEKGMYLENDVMVQVAGSLGLSTLPVLYRGPFYKEIMEEYTSGPEMISGTEANIREGIVIKPIQERNNLELGRVILKSVSESYLLRKGGTEYN